MLIRIEPNGTFGTNLSIKRLDSVKMNHPIRPIASNSSITFKKIKKLKPQQEQFKDAIPSPMFSLNSDIANEFDQLVDELEMRKYSNIPLSSSSIDLTSSIDHELESILFSNSDIPSDYLSFASQTEVSNTNNDYLFSASDDLFFEIENTLMGTGNVPQSPKHNYSNNKVVQIDQANNVQNFSICKIQKNNHHDHLATPQAKSIDPYKQFLCKMSKNGINNSIIIMCRDSCF